MPIITTSPQSYNVVDEKAFVFKFYPAFAKYIRENYLVDYIIEQIDLSYKLKLPILEYLKHLSKEQMLEMGKASHEEFLLAVENNTLRERLERTLKVWENDEIGIMSRDDLSAEDLTLGSYIRKQAQFKFLPLYTSDLTLIMNIISEIEEYEAKSLTASTNTYINIFRQRSNQHAYFIERIANTTPGSLYVYDLQNEQIIYSNNFTDTNSSGELHPDDALIIKADQIAFSKADDGEIRTIEFRIKQKNGTYKWSRGYRSIFKRNADGVPTQIIGITIDIDDQIRKAEELKERELQLNAAQIQANAGSFQWDVDNDVFKASPNYLKLLGLKEGASQKDVQKGIHPDDLEKVMAVRAKALAELGSFDIEYRYLVDGEEKVFWSRGEVSMKDGKRILSASVMDITNRHLLLSKLQQSENLYKQAQELGKIGNWTWDITTNKLEWTDELYRIFGLDPSQGEISFEQYMSKIHADDIELINNSVQQCLTNGAPYEIYHRAIMPDSSVKYILSKGEIKTDAKGRAVQMFGTAQDVTKQRLIENNLRESREFIHKIANTTPSLITSFNANTGEFTYLNSAVETLLGYDVSFIMKQGFQYLTSLVHPDDVTAVLDKHNKALEDANNASPEYDNEKVVEFKYRIRHANGSYKWFNTYGIIFDRNREGKIEHILNVSVDVTEQMEAEEKLIYKNLELQQSNSSLGEYAYVASHDLKEPLRKIATFGDLLQTTQKHLLTDNGKLYLDKIVHSAIRMQDMINDLLTISTISGNKTIEYTNLNEVLADVLQTLEYRIEQKKALIKADTLPSVKLVPLQFSQLLQNLISNALKFAHKDKTPEIHITHRFLKAGEINKDGINPSKKYLEIQVADNGIGFDKQFAHKIFTIFQRLHGKSEYEGTGIGLAICKKIAENHGGTIYADSNPGEGSIFTIIIPV